MEIPSHLLKVGTVAKELFFSFICEESCRVCGRLLLTQPQLLHSALGLKADATPALIHRWRANQPQYSRVLCSQCWEGVSSAVPLLGFYEENNQRSFPIVSGAPYSGDLTRLITRLKYQNDRMLVPDLATIMLSAWRIGSIFLANTDPIIVPVPLHWSRRIQRGFNQSELLASSAASILGIQLCSDAIKRTKATKSQQKLEKPDRLKNVAGAFRGNTKRLEGRSVIIVDDVCTSGATLSECVKEMSRCGAEKIVALTIARTVLRKPVVGSNIGIAGTRSANQSEEDS